MSTVELTKENFDQVVTDNDFLLISLATGVIVGLTSAR